MSMTLIFFDFGLFQYNYISVYIMNILEYYYNDTNRMLYVEFSTIDDKDKFYRVLELGFQDIEYYYPEIIHESDLDDIDEEFVIEILLEYLKENELPEQLNL